jgi:hypothetical protein
MGRWMSPDPYNGSMDLGNPQSLNRYSYVGNNPLLYTDPSGLESHQIPCSPGSGADICTMSNIDGGGGFVAALVDIGELAAEFFGFGHHAKYTGAKGPRPSLSHIAGCSIAAPILGAAQLANRTAGVGLGGSAGIGASGLGIYGTAGLQIVADAQRNAGLTLNGSFSFVGFGTGALGGGQFSLSTARNISQLSGPAFDPGGSYGPVGLDVAFSPDGIKTGTLTVGEGVGEKISAAAGASGTNILNSTNCKDMFP